MAFHHHAHNIVFAVFQLRGDVLGNFHLPSVIFTAVCVAAIDHQLGRQVGFYHLLRRRFDVFGAVIRSLPPRRITWQSGLPPVCTMAECPAWLQTGSDADDFAAPIASMAIFKLPSVPF